MRKANSGHIYLFECHGREPLYLPVLQVPLSLACRLGHLKESQTVIEQRDMVTTVKKVKLTTVNIS